MRRPLSAGRGQEGDGRMSGRPVKNGQDVVDAYREQQQQRARLTRDDGQRLGAIASKIERAARSMDPDGRDIRYLRRLSAAALDSGNDGALWVCEKGHVDDGHVADETLNPRQLCSRCGGECEAFRGVDHLAQQWVSRDREAAALEETPPYPADLLDDLASALGMALLAATPLTTVTLDREALAAALDRYTQEVGRENVTQMVARAVAELTGELPGPYRPRPGDRRQG